MIEKEIAQRVKTNAKHASHGSWFSSGDKQLEYNSESKALTMTRKRLEGSQREMAMLFFTINGAKRFFKDIRSDLI